MLLVLSGRQAFASEGVLRAGALQRWMGPHAADLLHRTAVARPVLSHPGRLLRPYREGVAQLRPQGKNTDVLFLVLVMCYFFFKLDSHEVLLILSLT